MSYTDLRDFEAEYVTVTVFTGLTVALQKLGGGTVGKAYTGTWRYIVGRDGKEIARGQDFDTATPHTHAQAANALAECFEDDSA